MNLIKMEPKLSLNKMTIARLSNAELNEVKGGFTYSLSTGDVCKDSNARWEELVDLGQTNAPVVNYINDATQQVQEVMHRPRNGYECAAL